MSWSSFFDAPLGGVAAGAAQTGAPFTGMPFGAASGTSPAGSAPAGEVRRATFSRLVTPEAAAQAAVAARVEAERAAHAAARAAVEEEQGPPPPSPEEIAQTAWTEGFERGYDDGYAEGLRRADEAQSEQTRALAALVQGVSVEAADFVRAAEDQVIRLALSVAERVIEREARTDPELVVGIVRAALAEIQDSSEVHVRVSPADHALIEPRWETMLPRSVARRSELLADEAISTGGCVVETRAVRVDAQLTTKLAQITKTFGAVLDGEPV